MSWLPAQTMAAVEPVKSAINGIIWEADLEQTNVMAGTSAAHLIFYFTNISSGGVTFKRVDTSCGCTTAQLPELPWVIAPATNGQIGVTVDLAGKSGTITKAVTITTDKESKNLTVVITIIPFDKLPKTSDAERTQNMKMASVDRQAVFQGNCANCHAYPAKDKYAKELYDIACAICHEGEHRASMVPNLHVISQTTNREFWHTWISYGRPHSLMPAFATTEGGPLTEAQIASLSDYLVAAIPSK